MPESALPPRPDGAPDPLRSTGRVARRVAKWVGITAGALIVAVVAIAAWIVFVGITIDAAPLRTQIADAFAQALGRPVRFDGPAELRISAAPRLRVGGLHIGNPDGFDGDFATLGEARLALDLWPLLGKRLRVHELTGTDVSLRLAKHADGRDNWRFGDGREAPPPPPPDADDAARRKAALDVAKQVRVDIGRIALERVALEFVGADGKPHFFDLTLLEAQSRAGQPLKVTMRGQVEKQFPYTVDIVGGTLDAVLAGTPDWPITLDLAFLGTTLKLDAKLTGVRSDVRFAIDTPDLAQLEKLLQAQFPKVGATHLTGRVVTDPDVVAIRELDGRMGRTTLRGELVGDLRGVRPKLSGRLDLPTLDLRPFLVDQPQADEDPKSLADTYRELQKATFSLKALRRADVDLTLAVGEWLSLPGDVRDAQLAVKLVDGRLDVPLRVTATGVRLEGALTADGRVEPPTFGLTLGTRDTKLGGLAELLAGLRGLDGRLAALDIAVAAQGDQGSELAQSLDIRIGLRDANLTYGNAEGARPVEFTLKRFDVALPPGKPLTGHLAGTLLGQPITASLATGSLEQMALESKAPLDFVLRSGPVRARLNGVLAAPDDGDGTRVAFALDAPRTAEVARWLSLRPGGDAAVSISGTARARGDEAAIDDLHIRLGRTELRASLARVVANGRPLLRVKLDAPLIDVPQLQSLLPPAPPPDPRKPPAPAKAVLEIPILPRGIDLTDADIDVDVRTVRGPSIEVREIAFDGRIRDGHMPAAPFSARVGGLAFRGAVSLDLRGEPSSALWLATQDADIGALLHSLGIAPQLDAKVASLRLHLIARSSLLGQMLARSQLTGIVEGGFFAYRDPATGAAARVEIDNGTLAAAPGAPIRLDLVGEVDDTPVKIALSTASAVDLVDPKKRVPMRLEADTSETSLKLEGSVDRDVDKRDVELALAMRGTRFDRLDRLARASLPPWGPWSLDGRFRMSTRGYAVEDLVFRVADSALRGRGVFDTSGRKPRLDIDLHSPRIQLDDFRLGDWSATKKPPADAPPAKPLGEAEARAKARDATRHAQQLLSREVLARQDATL
ncbi:MAG: AsmA family protein, partial [Burkholderiales bacterium]|nr:AsmA family protein [Burkholderiales bacterium]